MPLTPDEHAEMQLETDGAPPRRERTAFLHVYRPNWAAGVTEGQTGTWTELRPASGTERTVARRTDHGLFWLADGHGAPYNALYARRVSDQLARIIHEYV
jgi:hypothetical protein